MTERDYRDRIAVDPRIMAGKPVISGTRITVEHILRELGGGMSVVELLAAYPQLTEEDVRAAQVYAAEWMAWEKSIPLEPAD